jgi:hypothetical protein
MRPGGRANPLSDRSDARFGLPALPSCCRLLKDAQQEFSRSCCMNILKLTGLLLGSVSLLALSACNETEAEMAQARSAQTVVVAKTPREVCTEETVTETKCRTVYE